MSSFGDSPQWGGVATGRARILVTGVGGNVGQGILKALRASGLASWVVGCDCHPLSVGLFAVDRGYVVPPAPHPSFAQVLTEILIQEKIQLVLVGADAETLAISRLRDSLQQRCGATILTSSPDVVEQCHDKWLTALWFHRQGFPHPVTVRCDDEPGLDELVKQQGFPLVVKPRLGFASRGVVTVHSRPQLATVTNSLGEQGIVQQCVGTEEEEFTGSLFCPTEGEVAASILMRRELLQGTSYRIEPVCNPGWDEQLRHWGQALGGLGAINFQFRLLDNQPVCFEINARFSGTTSVRALLGYNDVAMAVKAFVLGEKVGQPILHHRRVLRYWQEMVVDLEQPLAGESP